jgi:hypothetical protein
MGQQQHASWAQSLFASLGDNDIQHVGAQKQRMHSRSETHCVCMRVTALLPTSRPDASTAMLASWANGCCRSLTLWFV